MPTPTPTRGHLFIVRGDLVHVACDAWLLPCDGDLNVSGRSWLVTNEDRLAAVDSEDSPEDRSWIRVVHDHPPDEFGFGATFEAAPRETGRPTPWLTNTAGGYCDDPAEYAVRAIETFLEQAAHALTGTDAPEPMHHRHVPLLGVPLIGSGDGGGSEVKGAIAKAVVDHLLAFVATTPVDVALVLDDPASYDACQACRTRARVNSPYVAATTARVWAIPEAFAERAPELARRAINGELVIFVGAGVGSGAGMPDWETLLRALGEAVGVKIPNLGAQVDGATLAAAATEIRARWDDPAVAQTLTSLLGREHVSLMHALIASIAVDTAITTNYDQLFEHADRAAGNPDLAVLPFDGPENPRRWLLKWHGTIDEPNTVVLATTDYDDLQANGGAIADVVSAALLLKHVLFVGYSMRDPDFGSSARSALAAIQYAAMKAPDIAASNAQTARFGTALQVYRPDDSERGTAEEWTRFIDLVHPDDPRPEGTQDEVRRELAPAIRQAEIVMDLIACLVGSHTSFLLDDSYEDMLDPGERTVKQALQSLIGVDAVVREPIAGPIRDLLVRYGWSPPA